MTPLSTALAAAIVVLATTAAGQSLPPSAPQSPASIVGASAIRGRIVAEDTGKPVPGVRVVVAQYRAPAAPTTPTAVGTWVTFTPTVMGTLVAVSNDRGEFEVTAVPTGAVMVGASKSGYVTTWYRQRASGSPPDGPAGPRAAAVESTAPARLEIGENDVIDGLEIVLARGGVLAGVIVDADGEPVLGALVQALRPQGVGGDRRLVADVTTADVSDERGHFRLHGLPPGEFAIAASAGPEPPARSPESERGSLSGGVGSTYAFFPGADVPELAELVKVTSGQEVGGLTILLAPRLAAITGRVLTPEGQPSAATFLAVEQPTNFAAGGLSTRTYRIAADGTFSAPKLPPGRYTLRVPPGASGRGALAEVELAGIDLHLTLTVMPGRTLSGRVVFEGSAAVETTAVVSASAEDENKNVAALSAGATFKIVTDGVATITKDAFVLKGLSGRVRLSVTAPGWTLKAIRHDGRDVADSFLDLNQGDIEGIEIVLTRP